MGKRKTEEADAVEATTNKRRRNEAEVENVEATDAAKAEKKRLKKEKKEKKKLEEATANETGADEEEQKKQKKKDKKAKKSQEAKEEVAATAVSEEAESENKDKKKKKKSKKDAKVEPEDGGANGQGDEKSKKKRKRDAEETDGVADAQAPADGDEKPSKKKSKDGKKSKKGSKVAAAAGDKNGTAEATKANGDGPAQPEGQEEEGDEAQAAGKNSRFIVFVGNLPFTATKEVVAEHFASLKPTSVRLLTERNDPKKSRGIAFVEFDNYSHMKTCLAKMHHSEFEDGVSAPRKINVELTAGGGGKTPFRNEKIKAKNEKLRDERARRMKAELEAKHKEDEQDGIHPSRRAQMHRGQ